MLILEIQHQMDVITVGLTVIGGEEHGTRGIATEAVAQVVAQVVAQGYPLS